MIGQTLSHYQVEEEIGRGGMGVVYRARDTKLERDVAIKVLPEEFARDEERLARFKREAKLLASLNHTNIASIYGLEHAGGTHYLVLELVEGETLADRIARGPIPVDDAMAIADRVADALEDAHERGIVHRDLKPANIKLTPEDNVKVLDFGLAKALVDESSAEVDSSLSPTITRDSTRVGTIMGTAAYMSPEQAKGKRVDKRTDIFAFGAVLYEMLTGKKAFPGDDVSEILAAVIKSEPDWEILPRDAGSGVAALLKKCLQKDPAKRLRDIGDAAILSEQPSVAPVPSKSKSSSVPLLAAAVVALAALGVGVWMGSRGSTTVSDAVPLRVRVPLAPGTFLGGFGSTVLALSPDNTHVALICDDGNEEHLCILNLEDGSSRLVPDTETAEGPFFSPDGTWVGFATGTSARRTEGRGALRKVAVDGGLPQHVADIIDYFGASWGDDGFIYVVERVEFGLARVRSSGGSTEPVAEGLFWRPVVLPGSRTVLAMAPDTRDALGGIFSVDVATGEAVELGVEAATLRFLEPGYLVFSDIEGRLMAAPFSVDAGQVTGAPVSLIDDLALSRHRAGAFDVSASGALIYVTGYVRNSEREPFQLVEVSPNGEPTALPFEAGFFREVSASPNGNRLAVATFDRKPWIFDLERSSRVLLPLEIAESIRWSPDGGTIAYTMDQDLVYSILLRAVDEAGDDVELVTGPGERYGRGFSPDGSSLLFDEYDTGNPEQAVDIVLVDIPDGSNRRSLVATTAVERLPTISPDGRWLAYVSSESGELEVYGAAYPNLGGKTQLSKGGGTEPRWATNGRELFYRRGDAIFVVDVGGGGRLDPGTPKLFYEVDGIQSYDTLPGGRLVVAQRVSDSGLHTELNLVLNWTTELERLVPAGTEN